MTEHRENDDWRALLDAERRVQSLIPGAILVGGTAVALHLHHRLSLDGDHVLSDLRDRYDEVLAVLEAVPDWKTERLARPVLILGQLAGSMTGLRQQRRSRPLEVEVKEGLTVPTLPELARIKCWLLVERNAVRDLVDVVAILESLGERSSLDALSSFDACYAKGPSGAPASVELVERLQSGRPGDRAAIELSNYKGLSAPWSDWGYVTERARSWAARIARRFLAPGDGGR